MVFSSWDPQCAILPRLLDALRKNVSQCQLHTVCPYRTDAASSLTRLQPANRLISLDVTLANTQIQALNSLRSLLSISRDLRNLSVNVLKSPQSGLAEIALCVPGLSLPPLKVLKLEGAELADYTTTDWQQCMDWASLRHLECTDLGFVPALSTLLTELLSLKVSCCKPWSGETNRFLCELTGSLPKIEHLDIIDADPSIGRSWPHCANPPPSLCTYKFHEVRSTLRSRFGCHLDPCDVEDMGRFFTRLEAAAFDIFVEDSRVSIQSTSTRFFGDGFCVVAHMAWF